MEQTIYTLIIEDNNESTGLFVDAKVFAKKETALIELQNQEDIFKQSNNDFEIEINNLEHCIEHYLFNNRNYINLVIKENIIEL